MTAGRVAVVVMLLMLRPVLMLQETQRTMMRNTLRRLPIRRRLCCVVEVEARDL